MGARWLIALAAMAPTVLPVSAQVPVRPEPVRDQMFNLVLNRRARLGLKVSLQAQDSDSIGAYVDAVTPGGPAAKAGVRSGDIITRLAGQSVLAVANIPQMRGRSLPGLRLVEVAARLAPNDTIQLEFRRGQEHRTAMLVTAGDPVLTRLRDPQAFALGAPDLDAMGAMGADLEGMDVPMPRVAMLFGSELSDLELAPINPDLGQYFGTTEGVLVITAPKHSPLGLRGGDVVLAVDGRKPSTPAQLLRILRSYERDESFKLDILRNKKRETLTARREPPSQ